MDENTLNALAEVGSRFSSVHRSMAADLFVLLRCCNLFWDVVSQYGGRTRGQSSQYQYQPQIMWLVEISSN